MTRASKFWEVQARVDLLTASWRAGHSSREIAANLALASGLPVTRNMVISKAARLGLPIRQQANSWGAKRERKARS